jgi:EAL domain-containing protein (putative c-di-GMP-specific phosphodiesterase class I)/GGDEF domain-containing protein
MEMGKALPYARLDPVTYLPNRQQFKIDYDNLPAGEGDVVMITLTDPAHYNAVLRALGHDYSDDFIRAGAARVREAVPADVPVYHVSVISFSCLWTGDPAALISRLQAGFGTPLLCGGIPLATRIGIGLTSRQAAGAADVLRTALAAAQDSRSAAAGWARYDDRADNAHRRGFLMLSQLSAAMEAKNQLSLNFQPKYDLATGRPTSAEALLRWNHPDLGQVSPAEFIPLAEATAFIHPLTSWVLEHAAAEAARWQAAGLKLRMAVNVSPHNLSQRGFAARAAETMSKHDVDPAKFEFEFTEGALAGNNSVVLEELGDLRRQGCHVALDDFGTGFSNLSYITHLPADIIKIDQSFIRRIVSDERSALVVRAIIQLAHRLRYNVVAEGIESAEVYRLLANWRCDEGQGFFMSRPVDSAAFMSGVKTGQWSVVSGQTTSN